MKELTEAEILIKELCKLDIFLFNNYRFFMTRNAIFCGHFVPKTDTIFLKNK